MLTLVLLLVTAAPVEPVAAPPAASVLATLHQEHPRLIVLPDDVVRVKRLIAENKDAAAMYAGIVHQADKILTEEPVQRVLIGPRLLDKSRKCLIRVLTLATVYRIGRDRRYADRAIQEMLAVSRFVDWHPSHFLDTAEMTNAVGIGYDWLYDVLSPDQRRTIREAIVAKGLREAEKIHRKKSGWSKGTNNWNQVCNGGITIGALAVAEDEPQLASYLVHEAIGSIQLAMPEYGPDGGWGEGPGYWAYATAYSVYFLAGLESALGTDFGLSRTPGFSVAGDFRVQCFGPTKRLFNFADASDGTGQADCMFWLARKFHQPLYAAMEREMAGRASAMALWWFEPLDKRPASPPTDCWFRHVDVAFLRSAWDDPHAVFVGFKAGDSHVNHSHLELGSFVLDADAQRWVLQLGADDYNLPGYFGKQRWSYYRLSTRGKNTLLVDGKNQQIAAAPIVAFHAAADGAHAVADLTAAYSPQVKHVARGIQRGGSRYVLVQDELSDAAGHEITWQIHTRAKIELAGDRATLQQKGETLQVRLLSPAGARFDTEPAAAPLPEAQQPDVQKLVIRLHGSAGETRIAVAFFPGKASPAALPKLVPLEAWSKQ